MPLSTFILQLNLLTISYVSRGLAFQDVKAEIPGKMIAASVSEQFGKTLISTSNYVGKVNIF